MTDSHYQENITELAVNATQFYRPDPVTHATVQSWLFADLLPWQQQSWTYLTEHFPNLPHAMLFAGNAGTGKRAFVYRFVAWALCQQKTTNHQGIATACGQCESCQWLIANTHPSVYQLPISLQEDTSSDNRSITAKKKASKATARSTNKPIDEAPVHEQAATIKIDDIRQIQPFVQQSSDGVRLVIIHQSEAMTLGASNALLKTLEEPADNVMLCLLTDTPSQLLPTIRSRLQSFDVSHLSPQQSIDYMQEQLAAFNPNISLTDLQQVNQLSGNAPFVAMDMLHTNWYQHRQTWIASWQAVRSGQRSPIQASDYWQKTLTLSDLLFLSKLMLNEIVNTQMLQQSGMTDINLEKLEPLPSLKALFELQQIIDEIWQDRRQHIQEKICYDKLIFAMQRV